MKFGLIYETERLRPDSGTSLAQAYREALEQVGIAEEAGFDCVWSIEHHSLELRAAASAPEMWLAAVAEHTDRIRIGHGVRVLPFDYNNPIRVAEMAAVLDIMSEGRLEFGTGRLVSEAEVQAQGDGSRFADAQAQWDEAMRMIPKMWTDDEFSWDSEHFEMPPRNVHPKPVQNPHPPLWMSGSDLMTAAAAGERGLGFMHWSVEAGEDLAGRVNGYRDAVSRAQPVDACVNEVFAQCTPFFCGRDDADARARAGRPVSEYVDRLEAEHGSSVRANQAARSLDELIQAQSVVVGGADSCAASIEWHGRQGVDTMLFLVQAGSRSHEDICDSLRRFGREVMPRFDR